MKYPARLVCAALIGTLSVPSAAWAAPARVPALVEKAPKPLPRAFGRGQAFFHRTAIAPYSFDNTVLRVHFDFPRGTVFGDETVTLRPKRGLTVLPFHSLGLRYDSVTANGKAARYTLDPLHQMINVHLTRVAGTGSRVAVEFKYSAQPQRGIYFIRPDRGYPKITPNIWSQGEMTDNRRWFPTWDEPNEKTPSELIATVPKGWTVVANGYLKAHRTGGATETWDWNAPLPKSTYLIAFSAGPLAQHKSTLGQATIGNVAAFGNANMPVDSFVQPPDAKFNAPCFGNTNDIVAYFQQIIGVKFPWEKYDQTTAERFTYGGMENASATTQTNLALHPAIENLERPCDGLVAHELAHQWWGDDVTMSDWANTWINEGYATYFQELWSQKHFGEAAFEFERYNAQQAYFAETKRYFRPIVDYVYNDPLDLFDSSGYPRPGEVLHMLRYMYGDARFFGALKYYLNKYAYKNADTHQFFAAIDTSLGTKLDWFMNEWFYRAAYPHYFVKQTFDAKLGTLTLDVTQKNHDGKPFRMPVALEVYFGGQSKSVMETIDKNHQQIIIDGIASAPQMVLFDPNNNIIRKLDFEKSVSDLAYQSVHAAHVGDREWALEQLAANTNDKKAALEAIRAVAAHDAFYGVRADAIAAAAGLDDDTAVYAGLRDADKRVVLASADAASSLKHPQGRTLRELRMLARNPDPMLAAAALGSFGALKAPGAYDVLRSAASRHSFRDAVAGGALRGLGALGDIRAFNLIKGRTRYGSPEQERGVAIGAMTRLALHAKKPSLVESSLLTMAQGDPLILTRVSAVRALGSLGQADAIPALRRIEANDSQQAVQNAAYGAILDIRDAVAMRAFRARHPSVRPASQTASVSLDVPGLMQAQNIPGLELVIMDHGRIVRNEAYGVKDVVTHAPVDIHTRFEIGSITKQFTAAAILQLQEHGKLKIDDSLAKYVPEYAFAKDLTLRQLLWQESGIPEYTNTKAFSSLVAVRDGAYTIGTSGTLDAILAMIAGKPLDFPAGTKWAYSNSNYVLLGRVVEVAAGMPWAQYIKQNIFARAGMHESAFMEDESQLADMATGYALLKGKLVPAQSFNGWARGAGAIVSTAGDLAKWDTSLFAGKIISHGDVDLMTAPGPLPALGNATRYGFGWIVDTFDDQPRIWHNGATLGFNAGNDVYPALAQTLIVLTNNSSANAHVIAGATFDRLHPALAAKKNAAAAGEDAAVTARAKAVWDQFMAASLDRSQFSDRMNGIFTPEVLAGTKAEFAGMGPARSWVYRGRTADSQQTTYEYRVTFATGKVLDVQMSVDAAGKVSGYRVDSE